MMKDKNKNKIRIKHVNAINTIKHKLKYSNLNNKSIRRNSRLYLQYVVIMFYNL